MRWSARRRAQAGPRARPTPTRRSTAMCLAMVFEKNSTRTRVSFDIAMRQLGGTRDRARCGVEQLGRGETIADTARVLRRMVDAIMIRTDDHAKIEEMARHRHGAGDQRPDRPVAPVPDPGRPADGDRAAASRWPGSSWPGSATATMCCNSLIEAAALMQLRRPRRHARRVTSPTWHVAPRRATRGDSIIRRAIRARRSTGADVVVTDTWVSMGQAACRRQARGDGAVPGRRGADGARPGPTRRSCTACPRIAARKSPTR